MRTLLIFLVLVATGQMQPQDVQTKASAQEQHSYRPEQGFVPNEATAVAIAEAVWLPIYEAGDSALSGIAADALNRYAKAFGGKKAFLKHVTEGARDDLPPVVLKQLQLFEK